MKQSNTPKTTTVQSRYREVVNENEQEYELMGAYVAGVIDASGSLSVGVSKASDTNVGFRIVPRILLNRHQSEIIQVLDNYALEHGVRASIRETETSKGTKITFELARRDDLEQFLKLIQPLVIVKHDVVEIMLNEILPRLRDGKASSKEGFLETMEYVDMVRELTGKATTKKYDKEYFEELWADDL